MILKINVTRDDLDNGFRNHASTCPIALATIRACKEQLGIVPKEIQVDGGIQLTLDRDYCLSRWQEDNFVTDFIGKYDKEDYVSPFEKEFHFEELEIEPNYNYEY